MKILNLESYVNVKLNILALLVFFFSVQYIQAQDTMPNDGNVYTSYDVKDLVIPDFSGQSEYDYPTLMLMARGGGGGGSCGDGDGKKGGNGAIIIAHYLIGTADDQIPPGSTIRFIPGDKGKDSGNKCSGRPETMKYRRSGGGGGGTGILLQRKGSSDWVTLMAASGGGGGAPTKDGKGAGVEYSSASSNYGSSGAGATEDGNRISSSYQSAVQAAQKGNYSGGEGSHTITSTNIELSGGGMGYGGGGGGAAGGGGGGGWLGGAAGKAGEPGSGGKSYFNTDYSNVFSSGIVPGATGGGMGDGYIKYALVQKGTLLGSIRLTSDTDKCLDLKNGNASNGANIQLHPCNSGEAQNWFIQDKQIKYVGREGYCLAIDGSDNVNVHIWECKDQDNEEWIFDIPFKLIRSRVDANKCLVVNGSNIEIGSCNYDPNVKINQQWDFTGEYSEILTGDNQQIHLSKDDRKCLDMDGSSSGSNVRVYECKDGTAAASQNFIFVGSRIKRADNTSLCLELADGKSDVDTNVRIGTCTGSISTQKWMYDGISGRIHSKADPNKCMRFTNGFTSNYTNIKLSECNDDQAEIFIIK